MVARSKNGDIMPTVEFYLKDLKRLLKRNVSQKQLRELILFAKGEVESVEDGIVKVDIKDTNRPDLWSVEGIARELRTHLTGKVPEYKVRKSRFKMIVDKKVGRVRAKTVCAVVKGLRFDNYAIKQLIQVQEKIHQTYGGNRKFAAIGIYDYNKIKFPIRYTTVKPDGIKFTPLELEEELTPREILKRHPCGRDYGHLINKHPEYPLMIDSAKNVLSIPPIINSAYTGKITEKTKNVFIEITGHEIKRISVALNVLVAILADRGGKIYSAEIKYPGRHIVRPDLRPEKFLLDPDYCRKTIGIDITDKEMVKLLNKAGYNARLGKNITVFIPAYRDDIMHSRDIIEDIAIAYDYKKIKPEFPRLSTLGCANQLEEFCDVVRDLAVGLGIQEVMTFNLTNKDNLFKNMNISEEKICHILNPISNNWTTLRNWVLPSLLEFLTNNMHIDYPQKIFEVGDCIVIDERTETKTRNVKKLTTVITDNRVSYEEIASMLDALMKNLGIKYALKAVNHKSFAEGRSAEILVNKKSIGIIGEISPAVLNNWRLEKPVVGLELDISEIFQLLK